MSHIVSPLATIGQSTNVQAAGIMTMNVLNGVPQFEQDMLIERTQSGRMRAKLKARPFGRPSTLSDKQKQDVREDLATGMSISAIARKFATSRQTIMRVRDEGFIVRSTLAYDFALLLFRPP